MSLLPQTGSQDAQVVLNASLGGDLALKIGFCELGFLGETTPGKFSGQAAGLMWT